MTEQTAPPASEEPIAVQAPEKPKYQEGQVLSINYTAAGPVKVIWRGGKQVVETNQPVPDPQVPGGMSRKELMTLWNFCNVSTHLLSKDNRKVPVMLQEVEQVIDKSKLKGLARKGLIDIQTLTIVNDDKKKQSYAFCWLTSLGLGVKEQFEKARMAALPNPEPMPVVDPKQAIFDGELPPPQEIQEALNETTPNSN